MDLLSPNHLGLLATIAYLYVDMRNKLAILMCVIALQHRRSRKRSRITYDNASRKIIRSVNIYRLIFESDKACIESVRMDRRAFHRLCDLLTTTGELVDNRNMSIEEMVASFLYTISHDQKNRVAKREFVRSGETISRHFKGVLHAVLKCHEVLLKKPEPVREDSTDERWRWFENCLGALDGTYIKVNASAIEKPRYRTRKNEIATNVLGVCSQDMLFIYILPGWEGSAADSRVLRDAISRRNGLRVPQGYYYLCDAGYPNGEGFLTPFRGQRYHLNDWRQGSQPTTPEEFFNYKHSSARNVIERCFGLLKGRWAILRGKSYFPLKTQCRIISACALLHNHVRREMPIDPLEVTIAEDTVREDLDGDRITFVETTDRWTTWRQNKAVDMFNLWRDSRGQHNLRN